jgi:mitotic checkpoint serine/threonine-protein kinase BUB1 beta
MFSNQIGMKMALFWIAWAFCHEKQQNFKAADKIYLNGIRQLAQPKEILTRRYHQFQRRMTRHFLNNDGSTENDSMDVFGRDKRKFGNNSQLPQQQHQQPGFPSSLLGSQKPTPKSSGNPSLSSKNSNNSLGFTIFSEEEEQSMFPTSSLDAATGSSSVPSFSFLSSSSTFNDNNENEKKVPLGQWKNLGSEKDRKKENESKNSCPFLFCLYD